ncbi:MAG: hypothetical protein FWD64_05820 [Acidobacteriaceae bacterium]|nr:hypothetical protein [Acidobacteriaceae bacterium]
MALGKLFSIRRLQKGGYCSDKLADAEQLFLAPPFTEDVVGAVSLISTRLPLKADEASRLLWQRESNAASSSEYEALRPLFEQMPKPQRILEIGPGLGRSVVFFLKKQVWYPTAQIDLYEATGQSSKYKQKYYDAPPPTHAPGTETTFCGNIPLLESMLRYNGIERFNIFDASQTELGALPGNYDLIYAFYSIGFHWSLEHYLDDLAKLMHERSVFICTLNKHFRPFARLKDFQVRVVEVKGLKVSRPERLMILSKNALPPIGSAL